MLLVGNKKSVSICVIRGEIHLRLCESIKEGDCEAERTEKGILLFFPLFPSFPFVEIHSYFMNDLSQSIEVWNVFLPAVCADADSCRSFLADGELERAAKFKNAGDAERFVLGRGLLRKILADYLNIAPAAVMLSRTPEGKPVLANGGLDFNVSHSRDRMLIAVTAGRAVGVDIEFRRDKLSMNDIVDRWFAPAEREFFRRSPADCFFELWAKKEAYAKARGTGIFQELKNVSVPVGEPPFAPAVDASGKWFFQMLNIDPEYAAAVVSVAPPVPVLLRSL